MIHGMADRLRELRINFGISQRNVAKRLGVSASIISGYETGERVPSVENLLSLSYLYRCSTDYLLGKEGASKEKTISLEGLSALQIKILRELIDSMRD